MPLLHVNKMNLYYEIHGDPSKLPLVLIPGLGQYHTIWVPVLDKLLEYCQVILIDNRGSGQSETPNTDYSTYDMAQDLNELLAALDIPKVNILGYSMGGMIAQQFALYFANKVNKLILYSTFMKMDIRTQRLLLNTARLFELECYDDAFNSILTNIYGDEFLSNPDLVAKTLQAIKNDPYPQSPAAFLGQFNACTKHDTSDVIGNISQPTMLIGGTRDILAMQEDMLKLQKLIPGAREKFISETAHAAHIENTNQFMKNVIDFLISN